MLIPTPQTAIHIPGALPLAGAKLFVDPAFRLDADVCFALSGIQTGADGAWTLKQDAALLPEAYTLVCDADGCRMTARDAAGAVYALIALSRLKTESDVPFTAIADAPKYAWRGLSVDVCRHFFPIPTLKKIIDLLASYRMNVLHFHLSDDQGFRFESKRFPLLNIVGSIRKSSAVRDGNGERQDGIPHGGYYTQEELRELLAYAKARAVDIVPEIEIPGHSNAILAAYPELSCTGEPSEVVTEYGIKAFSAHILCAGNDKTLPFLFDLLDEAASVFPSPYFHLGGDEAVKTEWQACEKCQQRMQELGLKDERALQGWLLSECAAHLKRIGKRAIVWNDALAAEVSPDVTVQHWTAPFMATMRRTKAHMRRGGQVILSPFMKYYLDYPYAMTPLRKTLRYRPARDAKDALGVECCIWCEWIATEEKLFFQLLPRLAVVAQTAWTGACPHAFLPALADEYRRYDALGLPYNRDAEKRRGLFHRLRVMLAFAKTDTGVEVRESCARTQKN